MKREYNERKEPAMSHDRDATYCEVPIVAYSPSYQQPASEAEEMTREALEQRKVHRG